MHGAGWIEVLRRIPRTLHDAVSFATTAGTEIMAQDILRLDAHFILLRGRLSGSQEAGKIIVLPYDQIVNLAIHKILKEKEVQEIFGGPALPPLPVAAAPPVETEEAEMEPPAGEPFLEPAAHEEAEEETLTGTAVGLSTSRFTATEPTMPTAVNEAPKPAEVSKSILLARLRQRLAEQAKKGPG